MIFANSPQPPRQWRKKEKHTEAVYTAESIHGAYYNSLTKLIIHTVYANGGENKI